MSFHNERFPLNVNYRSTGGPSFSTSIITIDSGAEERVSRRATPRYKFDAAYSIHSPSDIYTVLSFYNARMGAAHSFRWKDFADYASTSSGRTVTQAVSETDVQLGIGDNAETDFQLIKRYVSGPTTQLRIITKPIASTVKVALNDVNQTSGWTVNDLTGVVTFTTPPGIGVTVKAGFEFDVPVRFGAEIDEAGMMAVHENFETMSVPSIPIVEDVTTYLLNEDIQYGGAYSLGFAADITISWLNGRVQTLTPTAGSLAAKLPDATLMPTGGAIGWLFNPSAFALGIEKFDGTALFTLPAISGGVPGGVEMILGDVSGVKTWFWN